MGRPTVRTFDEQMREPVTEHRQTPKVGDNATAWVRALVPGLGLALVIGILVTAFAWPAANTEPRNVPIGIVAPPEVVTRTEQRLTGFDLEATSDETAARRLIQNRDAYGAILFDETEPPRVLTASAASPAVTQILQNVATQLGRDANAQPAMAIEDVAPFPESDPRGAGFTAAMLPMVMGGILSGIAISYAVAGIWRRIASSGIAAIGAGLTVALVVQTWLGSLDGSYWANAGVIALTIAAISISLVGLHAVIGLPGIGLGALIVFLLGNPMSGVTTAPEMLPSGWGTLGQLLPPGAGAALLRSTAFFDGAAAGGPLLVLLGWLTLGALLAVAGWWYRPASQDAPAG